MRVRFIGDGDVDDHGQAKACVVFGLVFPAGQWIKDPSLTTAQVRKLSGNAAFEVKGAGDLPAPEPVVAPDPEPDPDTAEDPAPDPVSTPEPPAEEPPAEPPQ